MVERELSKKRYFLAFIFTSAVFIIGLLLGLLLTSLKFDFIDQYQQDFRTDILTFDVQDMLLQEYICKFDVNQLDDEFGVMSEQVSVLEDKLGKYDEDVLRMKEYYSLLEIRHMLLVEKLKNYCDYDYDIILFFYSNEEDECVDCEMQGYLLGYIKQKYDNVFIYSFDINIDNNALELLKKRYNVNTLTLVINDEINYGFIEKEEIENKI